MPLLARLRCILVVAALFMSASFIALNVRYNCKTITELLTENAEYQLPVRPWWQHHATSSSTNSSGPILSPSNPNLNEYFNDLKDISEQRKQGNDPIAHYFNTYNKRKSRSERSATIRHMNINEGAKAGVPGEAETRLGPSRARARSRVTRETNSSSNAPSSSSMGTEMCDLFPASLVGLLRITFPKETPSLHSVSVNHPEVTSGGQWRPHGCKPRQEATIIVPYMNRKHHLPVFLDHIHRLLQRQQVAYKVIVVQQLSPNVFNRGALLNIGFQESVNGTTTDCAIFHDIDLLCEHDHNLYLCSDNPLHLSPHVNTLGYGPPGRRIGGVSAFRPDHFRLVNGFSNRFWGWGGEDDDMYLRISKWRKIPVERARDSVGRYTMLPHGQDPHNPRNPQRLRGTVYRGSQYASDGLNSLRYIVQETLEYELYTLISVHILDSDSSYADVIK